MLVRHIRTVWIFFALSAFGAAGFCLYASLATVPALVLAKETPACTSCDARHGRLAQRRAQQKEGTE